MKVVIIGAGVAGLSIGLRLKTSGCDVVVLERAQPGRGATWASAGMIAATAENADPEAPESQFAARAAGLWPDFAEDIESRSGKKIGYRRDGSLMAALTLAQFNLLSARAGKRASLLSREEALRLEPMLAADIAGALFAPDDAQVDNRALGYALALAFANAGGALQINEAVVSLEMADGRIRGARTPFALHGGDAFVIAAGAWSSTIRGIPEEALPPIVPVKGEMIALKGGTVPTHLVWGNEVYLVPRHDHLFVGATLSREGFDTATTRTAEDWLLGRAKRLMPELSQWSLTEHWAGLRPGSPDDLPVLGETAVEGLFVASGQFRNGILFAPAVADAMHSLILERRQPPDIRAFDPKRFAGQRLAAERGLR